MHRTCPFCDHYREAFSTCAMTDDDVDPEYTCQHWNGDRWQRDAEEFHREFEAAPKFTMRGNRNE